jgi:RES domain-containing protein
MVYTAGSLALAVLEVRVHIPISVHQPSARFVGVEMEIDDSTIEAIEEEDLPRGWRRPPTASSENTAARRFGKRWIDEARSVALKLPSAVIPIEHIFLLNPNHKDFADTVHEVREVSVFLDPRLWK